MDHNPSDVHPEALRRFREELLATPVSDADDFVRYLALAARIAALGDDEPLRRWPRAAQGSVNAIEAVRNRMAELEPDLLEGDGEPLGLSVCLVQDLRLAVKLDPSGFLADLAESLERLGELADDVPLDDAAAAIVAGYAETIPVPPAIRLGHVERPIGLGALAAIAARVRLAPVVALRPREVKAAVEHEELALCAGVAPAESLRRRFEGRHDCVGTLDDGMKVEAWARLHEDWSVSISVRASGERTVRPLAVRIGTRAAEPDADAEGMFLVEMAGLSPDARSRLLVDPIVVTLSDGRRVSF